MVTLSLPSEPKTLDELAAFRAEVESRLTSATVELQRVRESFPSESRRLEVRKLEGVIDELRDAQHFAEVRERELRQQELDAELERTRTHIAIIEGELAIAEQAYESARASFEVTASELSRLHQRLGEATDALKSIEGMRHLRAISDPALSSAQLDAILAPAQRSGRTGQVGEHAVSVLQQRVVGISHVDLERLERHLRAGGLQAQLDLQRRLDALPIDGI